MPIHVQVLEEGEGAEDAVLGVIWSFYWQVSQSRDRRQAPASNPDDDNPQPRQAVDPGTGLPMSANDLKARAFSDSGRDLMFSMVIPPVQLARASTYWWRDDWEGDRVQILAHTPRAEWTDEMLFAYEENLRRIKRRIHRLAEDHGWFDVRPINPKDAEMNDLDWVGEDRLTIGPGGDQEERSGVVQAGIQRAELRGRLGRFWRQLKRRRERERGYRRRARCGAGAGHDSCQLRGWRRRRRRRGRWLVADL
jgi:hypothetical protein